MQQNNNSFVDQNEQQNTENEMSIQKIIGILLANRVVFLTSVIAFIVAAWVYLRYATPEYEINAKILIKDDKKDADANLPDQGMLQSIGLLSGKSNVDNELEIIKTELLMEQVVKTLQLNVKYFGKGRIKTTELYNDRPFDHDELIHLGINIDLYILYIRNIQNKNYLYGSIHYDPNNPEWNIIKIKL